MGGARCLTCSETLRECRLRLGAPKFLFHADRINQIAAATAVACTDRSTSRWKQNQRANRKRKRSRENFNLDYKAYDLTKHLHPRPPYLTSYIGVRRFAAHWTDADHKARVKNRIFQSPRSRGADRQ